MSSLLPEKLLQWLDRFDQLVQQLREKVEQRYPVFYARFPDFWQLMRMHRPIGIYLLLWPTLWCLWIAAGSFPDFHLLLIFITGTILMRAAGCCINDYADRNFDGQVERTWDRPIVTGRVTPTEALKLCAALCSLAFLLVLFTNRLTVYLSFGALFIALLYPFTKRHTHLAQLFLGAAFSWGGLMAFSAQTGELPAYAWLLYVANFIWTIVYDTQYAMVDRKYDQQLGLKSTAILFAEADRFIIGMLQLFFLVALYLAGQQFSLGGWFQLGLVVAAGLFVYQQLLIRNREPASCFRAFLNNNYVGMAVFLGTFVDLAF